MFFQGKNAKRIKDNIYGNERLLTTKEIANLFSTFTVNEFNNQPGFILGYLDRKFIVNEKDHNSLIIAPPDSGKTKSIMLPNIIYNAMNGASQIILDAKEEIRRETQTYFESLGIITKVIDLRKPTYSMRWNVMGVVNKYIDKYLLYRDDEIEARKNYAKAEEYAVRIAGSIINQNAGAEGGGNENKYFKDTAKGLLASMILLVSENSLGSKRHIKSVYKMVQNFSGMRDDGDDNQLLELFKKIEKYKIDDISKVADFGYAAAIADGRTFKNIISSTLTQVLDFLQSDLESILCHDSELEAIDLIDRQTVFYIIVPDEKPTRHFLGSLAIQEFITELINIAEIDSDGERQVYTDGSGKLTRKVICQWDEFGNMPKIHDLRTLITAARSRNITINAVIHNLAQVEEVYGKNTKEIIEAAFQNVLVGCLAPLDNKTADQISAATGEYSLKYNTTSKTKNDMAIFGSVSNGENIIKRNLVKPEEIKQLKIGEWLVFTLSNKPYISSMKMYTDIYNAQFDKSKLAPRLYKKVEVVEDIEVLANIQQQHHINHNKVNIKKSLENYVERVEM